MLDTLRSGWITTGPKAKRFENEFAGYVGAKHALAVSHCTGALHLSLWALGIGPRRRGYHHAVYLHRDRRDSRLPRRAAGVR